MTRQEHIDSVRYWLGEFAESNCGYKEFAASMAESVPYLFDENRKLERVKDAATRLYGLNGISASQEDIRAAWDVLNDALRDAGEV